MSPGKTPNRHLRTEREKKERDKQTSRRERKRQRQEAEERQRQEAEERQRQEAEKRQRQEAEKRQYLQTYANIAEVMNELLRNGCVSLDGMSLLETYYTVSFIAVQQSLAKQRLAERRLAERRQEERRQEERRLEKEKAENLQWFEKDEKYWTIDDQIQRMLECFPSKRT